MIFKSTDGLLSQKLKGIAFSIILLAIGLMAIGQTYWLMPRHFTQIDDIGVAESLMVRNMDYRDDCLKNLQDTRGKALQLILRSPERACKIAARLNRFSIVASLWTYAPIQFWLTQAFLSPNHSYSYEEVKYWGRLPSFIFYLLGLAGFYFLLRYLWPDFSKRPLLVLSMTIILGLSLEERIHAAQMHSYAIGILANVLALLAYINLTNPKKKSWSAVFFSSGLFAIAIGMQYQSILLVTACISGVLISQYLQDGHLNVGFMVRYIFLVCTTALLSYAIVGNILGFSSRGANWNAGPNGEFIVNGENFTEKLYSFFKLIIFQAPENIYAITSGIQLPNGSAYFLGFGFLSLMALGIWYLWNRRAVYSNQIVLVLLGAYAVIYFAFIFLGKLTFSPTRHFLFYLPIVVLLMGYGALAIKNKLVIAFLKAAFLTYCISSLIGFASFAAPRMDKVSDGFFNSLLQESNASFLIFDGFDIEPMFTETKASEPIFWFASGGFNCGHKQILVPSDRKLRFLTYGKNNPLALPHSDLENYLNQIIGNCTPHTSNDKQINSIHSKGYLVESPSKTSIELSSRVLNTLSINNQFISLYEIDLNFDSHLYSASLDQGIDFSRPSYPEFLKYVSGMAQREEWGRWTDSNQGALTLFGFTKPLPARFTLELKAASYAPNISKFTRIRVGSQEKTIIVDGKANIYSIDFDNPGGVDAIEIAAPHSKPSKGVPSSAGDTRNIGIGLVHLRIKVLDKLP
jgi:hypothetical protein